VSKLIVSRGRNTETTAAGLWCRQHAQQRFQFGMRAFVHECAVLLSLSASVLLWQRPSTTASLRDTRTVQSRPPPSAWARWLLSSWALVALFQAAAEDATWLQLQVKVKQVFLVSECARRCAFELFARNCAEHANNPRKKWCNLFQHVYAFDFKRFK
jgi:hypothetical protein